MRLQPMGLFRACVCYVALLCVAEARRVVPSIAEPSSEQHGSGSVNSSFFQASSSDQRSDTEGRRLGSKKSSSSAGGDSSSPGLLPLNDRLVHSLPGLDNKKYPHRHWAGYVDVASKGHLFYWLFEAWEAPSTAPLVVWLNGGPGCSSMDGLFLENGPFQLGSDSPQTVSVNNHAWAAAANVLYIDQPVGTGLSYTTSNVYPKNDGDVNKALLDFFNGFFAIHKDLVGREMFLTGESHAGHYLPSLAQAIVLRNEKLQGLDKKAPAASSVESLNLGGVAIGNGWFDPRTQYDVSEFAHGQGLVSAGQVRALKEREKSCRAKLDRGTYMATECWDLLDDVVRQTGGSGRPKALMYDVRSYAKSSSAFPPNHDRVERYLNTKAVRAALHASKCNIAFKECTDPPYNALKHQDGLGVTKEVAFLLDRKTPMLFFNGQYDMICNHVGVEKALDNLAWSGKAAFNAATLDVWMPHGDKPAGYARSAGSLTLLLVLGSGHMVPMDKPPEALDMLRRFIRHKGLGDAKQSGRGVIKPRAATVSTDKLDSLNLLPPVIRESPTVGDGAVAVSFEHNPARFMKKKKKQRRRQRRQLLADERSEDGDGEDGEEEEEEEDGGGEEEETGSEQEESEEEYWEEVAPAVPAGDQKRTRSLASSSSSSSSSVSDVRRFVVTSSPEGISAYGSASPIVVAGLTNGRSYTFSVEAEVHDSTKNQVRRSLPSAGSASVTPGCGAILSEALMAAAGLLVTGSAVGGDGSGEGGGGGVESGDSSDADAELFGSLSEGAVVSGGGCGIHGVCALLPSSSLPSSSTEGAASSSSTASSSSSSSSSSGESARCFCDVGFSGKDCSKSGDGNQQQRRLATASPALQKSTSSMLKTGKRAQSWSGTEERGEKNSSAGGGVSATPPALIAAASFVLGAAVAGLAGYLSWGRAAGDRRGEGGHGKKEGAGGLFEEAPGTKL